MQLVDVKDSTAGSSRRFNTEGWSEEQVECLHHEVLPLGEPLDDKGRAWIVYEDDGAVCTSKTGNIHLVSDSLITHILDLQRWDGRYCVHFFPTVWNWSTNSTDETISRLQFPRVLATHIHSITALQRSDGNLGLGVPG